MTPEGFHGLAGAIAAECRRLAVAMAHLEGGLISYANGEIGSEALVTELQTIDATQQTLEDLARMLEVLSTAPDDGSDRTHLALDAIRQKTMRNRVIGLTDPGLAIDCAPFGEAQSPADEDVELW